MVRKLPPMNSLIAFLSAAKYESFVKAANELCVTNSAVSKQISILERHLELALFERRHHGLNLTKAGKEYYSYLKDIFAKLEKVTNEIAKKDNKDVLNISLLPSLTLEWMNLIIRDFQAYYKIKIENGSGYNEIDFENNNIDVAIRIGVRGKVQKGCVVENLIKEQLLCVCSPEYKKKSKIKNVSDLAFGDLLNNSSRPMIWENYFKFLGLKEKDLSLKYHSNFEHLFMITEAAKDGLGIALLPDFMIEKELKKGDLVIAFNKHFDSGYFYQLIYPQYKSGFRKIEDFRKLIKTIIHKNPLKKL